MTLGVEIVLAPLSGPPPPFPDCRSRLSEPELRWGWRPAWRFTVGERSADWGVRGCAAGSLSVSAGCERLPGSKGKGEGSRPRVAPSASRPRPLSQCCLGLLAKALLSQAFILLPQVN